jgi:hypothetical protein
VLHVGASYLAAYFFDLRCETRDVLTVGLLVSVAVKPAVYQRCFPRFSLHQLSIEHRAHLFGVSLPLLPSSSDRSRRGDAGRLEPLAGEPRHPHRDRPQIGPDVSRDSRQAAQPSRGEAEHPANLAPAAQDGSAAQKKSLCASELDSEINRKRRAEFAAQIRTITPERLIFLDESGVTTSMTRLRARCAGGRHIHEATPGGHWTIITVLGAMSVDGIIAAMTIEEATDGDIFLAFVQQVLRPALKPGDVVVMDNLSPHKAAAVAPASRTPVRNCSTCRPTHRI